MSKQEYIFDHDSFMTAVAIKLDSIDTATDHLTRFGRLIARRFEYEQPVMLGNEISIVQGGFEETGGNQSSPTVSPIPGTIIVVHNVDRELGDLAIERDSHIYSAVPENFEKILALRNERQRLNTRIQSINQELEQRYLIEDAIREEKEEYEREIKAGGVPLPEDEDVLVYPDGNDDESFPEETDMASGLVWY